MKITVKHFEGLSDSLTLEINGRFISVPNNKQNWEILKQKNENGDEVLVETEYGFQGSDIRPLPLKESIPYVHRFVSPQKARAMSIELLKSQRVAAKTAGFVL